MPKLAIIIPTLNEAASISSTIANIRAGLELCPDLIAEIIVVDGGSCDTTADLVERADARLLRGPRGRAPQLSYGVSAAADADVLVFMHADCCLDPDYFSNLAVVLRQGANWGFSTIELDDSNLWARCIASLMNLRSRLSGICTGDQVMYMTRAMYFAVGGIGEVFLMEDILLAGRLGLMEQPRLLRSSARVSARRWRQRGVIRTVLLMWFLRLACYANADLFRLWQWYR